MKICCVCKESKPLKEFGSHRGRNDGKQTYCRLCSKEFQTKWYYKRKYGISLEELDSLITKQDYRCLICVNKVEFVKYRNIGQSAVLDHCHSSGKIRGILCGSCNTGLGSFKDNITSLQNAIKYLQSNKS